MAFKGEMGVAGGISPYNKKEGCFVGKPPPPLAQSREGRSKTYALALCRGPVPSQALGKRHGKHPTTFPRPPAHPGLVPDSLRVATVLLLKVSFHASSAFVLKTPEVEDDSARVLLSRR